jgi:hypothetical protein
LSFSLRTGNLPGGLSPSISWSGGLFRIKNPAVGSSFPGHVIGCYKFIIPYSIQGAQVYKLRSVAIGMLMRIWLGETNNNELAYIERKISN